MFALPVVLQSAEEMIVHPGEMWFPPIVFGIIALVLLLVLALVAFSFRNMAASHPENPTVYLYEPVGHPGHPIAAGAHEGAEVHPGHQTTITGHTASIPTLDADKKH